MRFALLLAFAAMAVPLGAEATVPLRDGEKLVYSVSWAVVPGAGEIKIEAHQSPAAADRLIVTSSTSTRRLARMLLPFDASAESVFDLATGQLLALHEMSQQRDKSAEHRVTFDYARRQALYVVPGNADVSRTVAIPPGDPVDLIMALLETRTWNLKEGQARDALVLFDDDFYELTIHAARYEDITTPLGTFRTIVLEPRMEKTAPKGMFKRGSSVRVWISMDDYRLPVKFEVEFKIGTGTATLEYYEGRPFPRPAAAITPRPIGAAETMSDTKPLRP
jgi:hypothetical protein